MIKSEAARGERADILSFGLRHSFVIRHSGFVIVSAFF
jgi:hypothetical protein